MKRVLLTETDCRALGCVGATAQRGPTLRAVSLKRCGKAVQIFVFLQISSESNVAIFDAFEELPRPNTLTSLEVAWFKCLIVTHR